MNELAFLVTEFEPERSSPPHEVMPIVDGISLRDRVATFETAMGFEPSGGYSGLVWEHFKWGPATGYFDPKRADPNEKYWRVGPDRIWLLACDCGEPGCWPLGVHVEYLDGAVKWSEFNQPHRPKWSYADFGPFLFDVRQYREAVDGLAAEIGTWG